MPREVPEGYVPRGAHEHDAVCGCDDEVAKPMTLDLDAIEARTGRLAAWGVVTGKDMTMAEVLTVDVPALVAEVRRLRERLAQYELGQCEYDPGCNHVATMYVYVNVPEGRDHWVMCKEHARTVCP